MTKTVRPLILALIVLVPVALAATAQSQPCGTCQPGIFPGYFPGSAFSVWADPALLSANEYSRTIDAVNAWNQWATNQGRAAFITLATAPFWATVIVQENSALDAGTGSNYNAQERTLNINPLYGRDTSDFFAQIMVHEMGHAVGFTDVYAPGCSGQTIMVGSIDRNSPPFYTSLGGADVCALNVANPVITDPDRPPGPVEAIGVSDPLILDLSGNGIETSGPGDLVWFDVDGVGRKRHVGWTTRHRLEGFLWIDLHHDGRVDDGSELFGSGTVLPDGTKATEGFQALAIYDQPRFGGNHDGSISKDDRIWEHLRIWVDWNHDGVCSPEESFSVHELGVEEIRLQTVLERITDIAGNVHMRKALYSKRLRRDDDRSAVTWFPIESIAFQVEGAR
jgi:hypothetical protein